MEQWILRRYAPSSCPSAIWQGVELAAFVTPTFRISGKPEKQGPRE